MKPRFSRRSCLLTTLKLLLVGVLVWPLGAVAQAAAPTTFSGQATVVTGKVAGIPVTLVDTGPVAAGGGQLENSLLCYPNGPNCTLGVPDLTNGMLSAEVLHAGVVARGDSSRAEASVANISVNEPGVLQLSADFLMARARASCTGNGVALSGSAEAANLVVVVPGEPPLTVTATGEANQQVPLPGGVGLLIINQQSSSANSIDVSALHVTVPAANTDLTVAAAHADITCGSLLNCPSQHAFVTGGGFVQPLSPGGPNDKGHFALAGRDGGGWGHVMYRDSTFKLHVKNPNAKVFVTQNDLANELKTNSLGLPQPFSLDVNSLKTGAFQGAAILWWTNSNGQIIGEVLAVDMGEPGHGADYFEIWDLSSNPSVRLAANFLAGGNIQMHGKCPS